MSTVQDTKPSAALLATMNPAKTTGQSGSVEAQDRFMTLLVTQMKNQDPLNPLDNAQVTSQLAQLSTVTGIDKLNATLEGLMGSYQSSQSLQAASMIGHGVLTSGSNLDLSKGEGLFGVELAGPADAVEVSIKDAAGKTVRTVNLRSMEAGTFPLKWDGKNDEGVVAADGNYTFSVTATQGGKSTDVTGLAFGSVASVSTGAQGVKLNVPGIGAINLADVRQIL